MPTKHYHYFLVAERERYSIVGEFSELQCLLVAAHISYSVGHFQFAVHRRWRWRWLRGGGDDDGNIYPALYAGVGLATQQQFDEVFFGVRRRKVQSCSVVLYTDIVIHAKMNRARQDVWHFRVIGSPPSDHYFRSLLVCLFVQSFSQPSLIRFWSNLDICYMSGSSCVP